MMGWLPGEQATGHASNLCEFLGIYRRLRPSMWRPYATTLLSENRMPAPEGAPIIPPLSVLLPFPSMLSVLLAYPVLSLSWCRSLDQHWRSIAGLLNHSGLKAC
ncbi:hypothetical protein KIL84_022648 [Mauremys mutica]|uniref:Uncharacterized protein n=1 Tax=Mauremys mutica TaxID=74926 RepID=A0A9D4AP62_9SAUR|nr:hypothetical protein KIL84_022648 [Mauremys mutica]